MNDEVLLAQITPPIRGPSNSGPGTGTTTVLPRGSTVFRPPTDVSNTDVWIGIALIIGLGLIFWLAKRALTRHLIEQRAPISRASRAGLMLWMMLMSLALTGVTTFVSRKFLLTGNLSFPLLLESAWGLSAAVFLVIFVFSLILFLIFWRSARPR